MDRPARRSTRLADAIVANSMATRDQLGDPRTVIVYPSVAVSPNTKRSAWGPEDRVCIGTAARLVPVKGMHHLIDALAQLGDLNVELHVAGSGPERARLEGAVERAGLARRARFLGWRDDLETLMSSWHVYVQPSLSEGLGISALEAMSTGLPVVAGNHGGLCEIVTDGQTGFLIDPKDTRALAGAIRTLVTDPQLALRMGAAARVRIARDFGADKELSALSAVYQRLVA
jgi:glycosyltransferase involved in cell wall biosynthesis